jgi:pilus assembly protein CpaF
MALLTIQQDGHGGPHTVAIEGETLTIGKRSTNDVVVSDRLASREHCRIRRTDGGWALEDLGSRNGTFVNDARVAGVVPLADGARIRVGEVEMVFSLGEEEGERARESAAGLEPEEAEGPMTPRALKKQIHARLLDELDLRHEDFYTQAESEIRSKTEQAVESIIGQMKGEVPEGTDPKRLAKEITDEAIGLGPLEELLADNEVDEIMVNSWDRVYVEKQGKILKTRRRFTDNQQVLNIIRRIIAPIGRRVDESSPMVDARLPDGSRVNAIIAPLALTGPTLTIRKFAAEPFKIEDLLSFSTMTREIATFLHLCVQYRQNLLISGGTGSGKTTLLNVVSNFISPDERIVTIEDAAELKLQQEHIVSLEAKPPNIQGEGAIPIRELVRNSLRMRPDRIIVGECRGAEALDMLQAMNTGHDGSLTTLHANSARDALSRLETMVLMAGTELPTKAIREQVASAIDVIVHTARLSDGTRKVMKVAEITGIEGDTITLQDLFEFQQHGFDKDGRVVGEFVALGNVPRFIHELRQRGIETPMEIFRPKEGQRPLSH